MLMSTYVCALVGVDKSRTSVRHGKKWAFLEEKELTPQPLQELCLPALGCVPDSLHLGELSDMFEFNYARLCIAG